MLTPIDMQGRSLKGGFGYKKRQTDEFLAEIFESYEQLYKEHGELKESLNRLEGRLQYYEDLEGTLKNTLLMAEKASEETKKESLQKAEAIENDAVIKAQEIVADAQKDLEQIQNQTLVMTQQFERYRQQYKEILSAQIDLLDSKSYSLSPALPASEDDTNTKDLVAAIQRIAGARKAGRANGLANDVFDSAEEEPMVEEALTEAAVEEEVAVAEEPAVELPDGMSEELADFQEPVAEEAATEELVVEEFAEEAVEETIEEEDVTEELVAEDKPLVEEELVPAEPIEEKLIKEKPIKEKPIEEKPIEEEPVLDEFVVEEFALDEPVAETVDSMTQELPLDKIALEIAAFEEEEDSFEFLEI